MYHFPNFAVWPWELPVLIPVGKNCLPLANKKRQGWHASFWGINSSRSWFGWGKSSKSSTKWLIPGWIVVIFSVDLEMFEIYVEAVGTCPVIVAHVNIIWHINVRSYLGSRTPYTMLTKDESSEKYHKQLLFLMSTAQCTFFDIRK